ncbi:NAD(P)/FAD-dependent oxidoreductase [Taklimakanibacter lacteus]|uniref:NAD(P)/FAD-dependent oxidoreductase n=1 Tax=Taklimakanibacter lacteus TaxID=2268456 RepID=UPI0013C40F1B
MPPSHITIIGAGIIGISTAAFLQRAGHKVTVIDRVAPGEGCSFGNAGGVAFAEVVPTIRPRVLLKIPGWLLDPLGPLTIRWSYLPKALPWFLAAGRNALPHRVRRITAGRAALGLRAVSDFDTLLHAAGATDLLVKKDSLRLYDTEAQYRAEEPERIVKREHGYDMTRLSPGEIAEIEPDLARDFACGAFHGGWYYVRNPRTVVTTIAEHLVRNGGEILQDEVVQVTQDGTRATALTLKAGGERKLDRLVICAGAYSNFFARQFGDKVLLEAERGYHLVIPDPGITLGRSLTYVASPMAMTPMDVGLRLAGTDEFAGLDAAPNWKRADVLWPFAKRCLPKLRAIDENASRWMGRRPGTPDGLPVIGPSRKVSNVWYGFGHSHMGLTWGPTTGRLLSEMLSGAKSNTDLSTFRVDRF